MAQAGYTPIQLYYSSTTGNVPSLGNLSNGELAINTYDGKLFYKNSNTNTVTLLASSANTSATVSSVGVSVPAFLTVSNSPVTTSGTIAISYSGTALPIANGGTGSTSTTYCSLTSNVSGILPTANGGTGSSSTAYCSLTTNVSGILPAANGGSGASSLTGILVGNGTSAFTTVTAPSGAIVGTTDSQTLTNKTLTNPTITNYTESVVAIGTVTTASTISLTSGTVQTATLTASTACTFTMPTATAGKSFVLLLKQAASTGNGTATFTGVKWNSSGAPTITATAGKMDILSFVADGTNWYGSYTQGYTP